MFNFASLHRRDDLDDFMKHYRPCSINMEDNGAEYVGGGPPARTELVSAYATIPPRGIKSCKLRGRAPRDRPILRADNGIKEWFMGVSAGAVVCVLNTARVSRRTYFPFGDPLAELTRKDFGNKEMMIENNNTTAPAYRAWVLRVVLRKYYAI
ncbi:hypothetical protein EVAR_37851_1 [Eumeta japonica]|uniref:Uncharacterized protein n=1 Tax=Eumeta variegata TaxID=151549 RepID=A0A4C1X2H6_EUMVA|nr:hypothetical protein EVAR_37851_1 [Eumeta japonica]